MISLTKWSFSIYNKAFLSEDIRQIKVLNKNKVSFFKIFVQNERKFLKQNKEISNFSVDVFLTCLILRNKFWWPAVFAWNSHVLLYSGDFLPTNILSKMTFRSLSSENENFHNLEMPVFDDFIFQKIEIGTEISLYRRYTTALIVGVLKGLFEWSKVYEWGFNGRFTRKYVVNKFLKVLKWIILKWFYS